MINITYIFWWRLFQKEHAQNNDKSTKNITRNEKYTNQMYLCLFVDTNIQ